MTEKEIISNIKEYFIKKYPNKKELYSSDVFFVLYAMDSTISSSKNFCLYAVDTNMNLYRYFVTKKNEKLEFKDEKLLKKFKDYEKCFEFAEEDFNRLRFEIKLHKLNLIKIKKELQSLPNIEEFYSDIQLYYPKLFQKLKERNFKI